ncbi:hypothetical protein EVAR_82888_1 [Eumeta japonica]|uniref:Uncharacterized protein n=1 Tax=Eumeta variegata TaxID=151549 RepID=A0A4C1YGL6_EUMVA|nr:hypothetical protein EVAR_82888_1 [Eumeta japonica]
MPITDTYVEGMYVTNRLCDSVTIFVHRASNVDWVSNLGLYKRQMTPSPSGRVHYYDLNLAGAYARRRGQKNRYVLWGEKEFFSTQGPQRTLTDIWTAIREATSKFKGDTGIATLRKYDCQKHLYSKSVEPFRLYSARVRAVGRGCVGFIKNCDEQPDDVWTATFVPVPPTRSPLCGGDAREDALKTDDFSRIARRVMNSKFGGSLLIYERRI